MMKKLAVLFVLIAIVTSCKKERLTAKGPTDVRVKNLTDQTFVNVTVDTGDEEQIIGTIESGAVSSYFRFETAFPKAEINAMINGIQYSTGTPDNTYETYIGPDMITYEVYISNDAARELKISNVVLDGPIQDL